MIKTRQDIKDTFVAGSYPSEADYHDALDSYVHKDDLIAASQIEGLDAADGGCRCQACRPVTLDIALQWLYANSQGSVRHVEFYASPQLERRVIAIHADGLALQAIDDPSDLATSQNAPTQYHLEACAEGAEETEEAEEMDATEDSETGESGGTGDSESGETAPVRYLLSIDAAPVRSLTLTYCHQGADDTITLQHLQLLG